MIKERWTSLPTANVMSTSVQAKENEIATYDTSKPYTGAKVLSLFCFPCPVENRHPLGVIGYKCN